jgi:hypothetical protein
MSNELTSKVAAQVEDMAIGAEFLQVNQLS